MPEEPELLVLLRALRDGDPDAPDRLISRCAPGLHAFLRSRFAFLPAETRADAANDALLALISNPERYQPERGGSVSTYLAAIARHKALDALRTLQRQREIFVGGTVELALVEAKNYRAHDETPLDPSDPDVLPPEAEALLNEILPDPRDRRLWECLSQGRTEVADVAPLLGLAALSPEQRQAEWKRHRDRVMKRVQRRRQEFRHILFAESPR